VVGSSSTACTALRCLLCAFDLRVKLLGHHALASLLEESLPPYFLLLLVTIKGTLTNPLAEEVEEAWSDSLRLRAGRVEHLGHHVVHGLEEVESKGVGPKPPATLIELQAEKVADKLRILDAVVLLACRAQEIDIEDIVVKPAQLVVFVSLSMRRIAVIYGEFVAQTQSARACIEK